MRRNNFRAKRILVCILAVLLTYISTSVYVLPYSNAVEVLSYKYGSRGATITEIQRRLKAWGYYTGNLDGVYGYNTYLAVKKFQTKNGLTADGVAGNMTLQAIGINIGAGVGSAATGKYSTNSNDVLLLSRLINGEARGEPYEGQVAVGAVIMNRTRDPRFPNTIAGVIYQPGAFTAIVDGQIYANLEASSTRAARDALNGWDPSGGAIYYFNPATATSSWIWSRPLIKIIGNHRFCR
jgi:N-acetylmuramoyl-L-alanine amidase